MKKRWIEANPERMKALRRRDNGFRRANTPAWANKKAIRDFYENTPPGMQVDHIIPLKGQSVCGLHIETNLQYLTEQQNKRKKNKWVVQ